MKKLKLLILFILAAICACSQPGSGNVRLARAAAHESVTANINLGVEYMREGNFEKALGKLERARQIDPGYYGTYNMFGLLHQRMGQNSEAEKNFKKALNLSHNDPATLNNYGQFLCQTQRPGDAEDVFLRAAKNPLNKTPEVALTNAGLCALVDSQPEKAETYLRRALELNPKIPDALIRMSKISYDKQNYLSARGYLQRYLEIARHSARSLWLGIRIEKELGDEDAVSSYALLLKNNFSDSQEAGLLANTGAQ